MYFRLFFIFLFHGIASEKLCLTSTDNWEASASFVSVITFDRDVIISEFEYDGIHSLRVARITPENHVVWNYTYVLSPLTTTMVLHQELELVWFAQYIPKIRIVRI